MRKPLIALIAVAMLTACAQRDTSISSELYAHPPGSMGNPNAQATVLTGGLVLLLTAALVHGLRDQ